jgi:hypothetical protein
MDDWCAVHKHTKLIAKNEKAKYIGGKAFDSLIDIFTANGDCRNFDVLFSKTGQGMKTKYSCTGIMNPSNFSLIYANGRMPMSPMTDEEKNYEFYDIGRLTSLTRVSFIIEKLGDVLQWIDSEIGGNYYNRLMAEADAEKNEKEEKIQTPSVTAHTFSPPKSSAFVPPQTKPAFVKPAQVTQQSVQTKPSSRFQVKKPEMVKPVEPPAPQMSKSPCPVCGELINDDSTSCEFCHTEFENQTQNKF